MVPKVTKHPSDTPVDILLVTRSPAIDGLIYSNIGDLMLVDHGRTITIHIHHVYLVGGPHEADDGPLVGVLGLAVDDGQLVLVVHLLLVRAWARVSQCRVAVSRVTRHVSRVQIWAADKPCKLRDACHSWHPRARESGGKWKLCSSLMLHRGGGKTGGFVWWPWKYPKM